jgi:nucleotide-binding universal stress UspA family protein
MKILVGYRGGSNLAEDLLGQALDRAVAFKAAVKIVTVMKQGGEKEKKQIAEAEAALEKARERFAKKGIDCQTHLLIRGLGAGEDLLAFATENKVDEIVIGITKQRTRVGKLLMGSTAQTIILQATCPVVTIR